MRRALLDQRPHVDESRSTSHTPDFVLGGSRSSGRGSSTWRRRRWALSLAGGQSVASASAGRSCAFRLVVGSSASRAVPVPVRTGTRAADGRGVLRLVNEPSLALR